MRYNPSLESAFKVGDKVEVLDPALLQLYELMKRFNPDAKPGNIGFVSQIMDDGELLIEFPIGDDPMEEHSQVAPYPPSIVRKID